MGAVDVLWASAGAVEQRMLGEITEQHFDATFGLNARGTLFTVQKALPLFNDGGSIFMTGSIASVRGYPSWSPEEIATVACSSHRTTQATSMVWS
jgi:NAD(P)-dependent dehydrogenase (short-subunit alcohol dehydrogenase family)